MRRSQRGKSHCEPGWVEKFVLRVGSPACRLRDSSQWRSRCSKGSVFCENGVQTWLRISKCYIFEATEPFSECKFILTSQRHHKAIHLKHNRSQWLIVSATQHISSLKPYFWNCWLTSNDASALLITLKTCKIVLSRFWFDSVIKPPVISVNGSKEGV